MIKDPLRSPITHTSSITSHTNNKIKMKIQCDMCEKHEATVYCTADEASLCHHCDRRVHHANKLAGKHPRFSLHHSSDQPPLCDICQDKRAFLFCKEDRAILCKQCDISIHEANAHTQYHSRFLLAGVKLSQSSSCFDGSSDQALCSSNSNGSRATANSTSANDRCEGVSMEASSLSEYLIETLPGWQVEEFLNPSDNNGDLGSFWSDDLDDQMSRTSSFSQRLLNSEMENFEMLQRDRYTFNTSSGKRSRQIW